MTKAFWLKDFLPLNFPGARIFTFGYDSISVFGDQTAESIRDCAEGLLEDMVLRMVSTTLRNCSSQERRAWSKYLFQSPKHPALGSCGTNCTYNYRIRDR